MGCGSFNILDFWRPEMTKWLDPVVAAALAGAVTLGSVCIVSPAWSASPGVLKSLDPDNDGTVDLNEAKLAATNAFDRLDRDKDGTLDKRELRGRVSAHDLAGADPDKDGTLDKPEYMALVEQRFKAADPDNDGTLDAKELRSRAGRVLLRVVK
jgi:hypothetical protein